MEDMQVKRAVLKSESQVITGHIDKSSKARNSTLEKYLDIVTKMEEIFEVFSIKNILRLDNERPNRLAKYAA